MICNECPLQAADRVRQEGGEAAEAHFLRLRLIEQMHLIGRMRSRLVDLGVDPDIPYEPHPHSPADSHG